MLCSNFYGIAPVLLILAVFHLHWIVCDIQIMPRTPAELQEVLIKVKMNCAKNMGFSDSIAEKVLLYEENPTPKEKCLMKCILKSTNLMDEKNKLSTESIANLAGMISNRNELVVAIATATADNCNRRVVSNHPCEAAYQINKCIGRELATHRIKLFY